MLAMIIALSLYRLTEKASVPLWHPFGSLVRLTQSAGRWRIVVQGVLVVVIAALQWVLLPYWVSQIVSGLMLAAAFGVAGDIKRLVEGRQVQDGVSVASGTLPMLMADHLVWRHLLPIAGYTLLGCFGLYWVMWLQSTRAPGAKKLRWLVLWLLDLPLQRCLKLSAPYLLRAIAERLSGKSRENWVPAVMKMRTRLLLICFALLVLLDIWHFFS